VGLLCRTLPSADPVAPAEAEWNYHHWAPDEAVFQTVSRRLFECNRDEQKQLWEPIVSLPVAAHHHICSFLNHLLIESLRFEPYRIAELVPVWRGIAERVFASKAPKGGWRDHIEIQRHVLLYDSIPSA